MITIAKNFWRRLRARLLERIGAPRVESLGRPGPVLLIVEGPNDVQFLKRISAVLHADEQNLPNLADMERRGDLLFLPIGGGGLWPWTHRLAGLALPEFHLYDRETPPATEARLNAVAVLKLRPHCRAFVTGKRALENYLHPAVLRESRGIDLEFSDDDSVPDRVAKWSYERSGATTPWDQLTLRARKRLRYRAKLWLNTDAAERMTPDRLAVRDPASEVRMWLESIAELATRTR